MIDHIDVSYRKCSIINFFNAIKEENKNYIEFKDFDIYIREILKRNKSLQFLLEHTEFLERYIESVIVRIYYYIDINDTNRIYLNDLRKHDLAHIWCFLDDSVKVQHIKNYFSYSHFYVYYCTFCQTSSCKDMLIDDNDLYRFDNHSLNDFIVNRIWSRISMKLGGPNQKYMCLNDWIYFIMNYEDMTTNRSIEFWFKLIDLDADCVIRDRSDLFSSDSSKLIFIVILDDVLLFPYKFSWGSFVSSELFFLSKKRNKKKKKLINNNAYNIMNKY